MSDPTPVSLQPALEDTRLDRAGIEKPLVSVIVTNFNYAPYVIECLRSVARQTWAHWECIVVDDRSTDESPGLIARFVDSSEAAGRFRVIRHEVNSGQMEGIKSGLAQSKGVFAVLLDADDVLLEDFMDIHLRTHLGRKPVAFTSSNQYQIDGQGRIISGEHLDHQSKGHYRHVKTMGFQRGFWIWATASSMMFRTETLRLILEGQPETFRICADYYIAHFANLFGSSMLIPTIHGCYRRHGENNFGSNPVLGAINSVGCMTKHPPHQAFRKAMISHLLANYSRMFPILGPREFMYMIFRIATLEELRETARLRPEVFPLRGWRLDWQYLEYRLLRRKLDKLPWSKRLEIIEQPF